MFKAAGSRFRGEGSESKNYFAIEKLIATEDAFSECTSLGNMRRGIFEIRCSYGRRHIDSIPESHQDSRRQGLGSGNKSGRAEGKVLVCSAWAGRVTVGFLQRLLKGSCGVTVGVPTV